MALDPTLVQRFTAPPPGFGPTPLWWWSAEAVTEERLRWQLQRFHDGGVDDLVVINLAPSGPQFGTVADDPAWFSETWWERFTSTCDGAAQLGMRLWFYDQIGFSGANLQGRVVQQHPWAAGASLHAERRPVEGGRVVLRPGDQLVAAYAEDGRRVAVDDDLAVARTAGPRLQVVTARPSAFDYLSPEAVAALMDVVHGEFDRRVPQHLGTTVVGSFQDELPATNTWSPRLPAAFAAAHGYDLLDRLPALFGRGDHAAGEVRADFAAVRAHLTEEALFRPLGRWHAERGMLVGADQSNPARAGLPVQSTQIYTDYPRTHRHLSADGSDHEGDSKFHASLAHLYEHERVWLEAFHSSGWGGTLEDTWDWLIPFLRSGATLYNPHATYFSTVGGWFEWAPPSTDWRQPYWPLYRDFASAVARTTAALTWGTYDADVAVLHPTATAQAAVPLDAPLDHFLTASFADAVVDLDEVQATYLDLVGKDDWFHFRPSALDAAGIAFDVLDDASLQRGGSADGLLRIAGQRYSTVVLPSCVVLEQASAAALGAFMDAGGRVVVVGQEPRRAAGTAGDDAVVTALADHPRCHRAADVPAAVASLPRADQHVVADGPLLVRRSGTTGLALLAGAYPNATAHPLRTEAAVAPVHDYDTDRRRYADAHDVTVRATVTAAEVWDPTTGARRSVPVRVADDGTSLLHVDSAGAPLLLLVWEEAAGEDGGVPGGAPGAPGGAPGGHEPAPAERREQRTVDVSDGWSGELLATLDNAWGDHARPVGSDVDRLQVWSFDTAEDDGEDDGEDGDPRWTRSRATWGQRVLVSAPAAQADLGRPLSEQQCRDAADGLRPLAEPGRGWSVHEHSASRGPLREPGVLGLKGRIPHEFVVAAAPRAGEAVAVRALVTTGHRGPAELVLCCPAPVSAWWNGRPVDLSPGYSATAAVEVTAATNVLEYRISAAPGSGNPLARAAGEVGSSFTLAPPGGHPVWPEYMAVDPAGSGGTGGVRPDGRVVFTAPVPAAADVGHLLRATLVVGAARAATVRLDEHVVARQAKVEYYDSEWGATPAFFTHDVTDLLADPAGAPRALSVELETDDAADVVYVDLALVGRDGVRTLGSGPGWSARTAGRDHATSSQARQWMPVEAAHAVLRPHPLPEADWLLGAPLVGEPVLATAAGTDSRPRAQLLRVLLPAGTARVHLPLALAASAELHGRPLELRDGAADLPEALRAPAVLQVRTEPTATHRGGAALTGPLLVDHVRAPIALGDWREIGLAAWSGAVTYRRTLDVPTDRPWTLDLGDLRGAVTVAVDGQEVARAFCAPFRWTLRADRERVEVAVTVFGTLGPLLHESTSTTWVFPVQRSTGLYGPVSLTV